jgi:hypothetical protein
VQIIAKGSKRRERDGRWCEVTVELREGKGGPVLSITGDEGAIVSRRDALRQSQEYWESYFDDEPESIAQLNERCGTRFRSPRTAAKYVRDIDGELHGLDGHVDDGKRVYLTESCGQIRDEIDAWFPEVALFFSWHLNNTRASCVHQEARGETTVGLVCPDCGWKYGHAWAHRPLPAAVLEWARSFGKNDSAVSVSGSGSRLSTGTR